MATFDETRVIVDVEDMVNEVKSKREGAHLAWRLEQNLHVTVFDLLHGQKPTYTTILHLTLRKVCRHVGRMDVSTSHKMHKDHLRI